MSFVPTALPFRCTILFTRYSHQVKMYTTILATLAFAATTLAAPTQIEKRQGAVTCGSTVRSQPESIAHSTKSSLFSLPQSYSASQVSAAVNQGCNYYSSGQTVGSNDYPHRYNNYEGFDFRASSPWQEFPILRSGVYTGGEFEASKALLRFCLQID